MSEESVTGQDFIILSTQDWDSLPTRKHRWARWWAESGNRVLYVEQQMHWAGWLAEIRAQFSRAWRWLRGPREVAPNLWVFTLPIVLPFFQMWGPINWINNLFLLPVLKAQMRRLSFENVILWTYTAHSGDFVGKLGEHTAVYECVDDITAAKGLVRAEAIGKMERRLIELVDQLIVTAPALLESKRDGTKRIMLSPNGVDADHFAHAADDTPPAEAVRDLSHPILGYLGTLNYWIDTKLLARIARAHPEWTVLMVGPHDLLADTAPLEGLSNVVMTGRVPYTDVPDYVRAFDVCLNPYVLDGVAEHCSPLKLYEYVATGKPVVSVDMPEAHKFEDLIHIAHSPDEFEALIGDALAENGTLRDKRLAEAQNHTWRGRFSDVQATIAQVLVETRS